MPVQGSGPFEFTDLKGNQASIPLGALEFAAGKLQVVGSWPPLSAYPGEQKDVIAAFLADQLKGEIFSKPPAVSARTAMVISAADNGVLGDEIEIKITTTPNADPFEATFDVEAEQSETYTGLKFDTIADVLGTEADEGSKPGLAHVLSGSFSNDDPPPLPAEIQDAAFSAANS